MGLGRKAALRERHGKIQRYSRSQIEAGNERSDARGPCCAVDLDVSGFSLRCLAPVDVTSAAGRALPNEMAIRPRARSRPARANHPVS
jgi:hypothetical protein